MYKIMYKILSLLICFFSLSTFADDNNNNNDLLKITNAWARPANAGSNSAAYMQIQNLTDNQIQIIAASALLTSNNTELHDSFVDNNVIKMRIVDNIILPAKGSIEFSPGKLHIMLIDLIRDLKIGDSIDIALVIKESSAPIIIKTVISNGL